MAPLLMYLRVNDMLLTLHEADLDVVFVFVLKHCYVVVSESRDLKTSTTRQQQQQQQQPSLSHHRRHHNVYSI